MARRSDLHARCAARQPVEAPAPERGRGGHRGGVRNGRDRRLLGSRPRPTESVDVAAPAPPPNSIAVLPFDNLSPDPDDAYFAVGLHEAILSQLANVREMHVVARASVQGYAGTQKPTPVIARELNVETVLDGSVRYADGQVLVTMHLSDGATNTSLWSDSYEREFSKIFTIQNDIALEVAKALKAELLPAERERVVRAPTTSLPAYTCTCRRSLASGAQRRRKPCLPSAI